MKDHKKCPFCRENKYLCLRSNKDFSGILVQCEKCDVYGPVADTEKEATRLWDRRVKRWTLKKKNIRGRRLNPQPKNKPVRLTGKAYTEFRKAVAARAYHHCEVCKKFVPVKDFWNGRFNKFTCGHVSHIKSRGSGGGDTLDNAQWFCFDCHRRKHDGNNTREAVVRQR